MIMLDTDHWCEGGNCPRKSRPESGFFVASGSQPNDTARMSGAAIMPVQPVRLSPSNLGMLLAIDRSFARSIPSTAWTAPSAFRLQNSFASK